MLLVSVVGGRADGDARIAGVADQK